MSAGYGTTTTVGVSFVSLPNSSYTIDFYASPIARRWRRKPLSRLGLGDDGRERTDHSTDDVQPPGDLELDTWITATATDQAGDTSEFSHAWQLTALSSQVTVTPSISSPAYGQSLTFTATVAPFGSGLATPTGTIQFQVDGSPFGSAVTLVDGAATSISTAYTSGRSAHDQRGLLGRLDLHHLYRDHLADDFPRAVDYHR